MHFHGRRTVRLWTTDGSPVREAIDAIGHMPLPPYIKRDDRGRGPRAVPDGVRARAGIDCGADGGPAFHARVLDALAARGVERAAVTLHVGYGTFQPIRVEQVDEHQMEAEHYEVTRGDGGRSSRAPAARAGASSPWARRRRGRWSRCR